MISLLVTTRSRTQELERLLTSLDAQSYKHFEVLVVDQNEDDRLAPLLARHGNLNLRRLHSGPGASRGRNAGLRAFAGDLVAFPDDDCRYPADLLATVVEWFKAHPDYDGLLTGMHDLDGKRMAPKFAPREGQCTKDNILRCAIAWNLFLRAPAARAVGFFREDMGPGAASPYQSGEDLDFPVRALARGLRLWNAPRLVVQHPELNDRERLRRTAYSYGMSVGRVWRMHEYSRRYAFCEIALRSLGGAAFHLCKLDRTMFQVYLLRAAGQFRGYRETSERMLLPEPDAGYGKS